MSKHKTLEDYPSIEAKTRTLLYRNMNNEPVKLEVLRSRIILIDNRYFPAPEYPVWGSPFAAVGTVVGIHSSDRILVRWDNGEKAVLHAKSLAMYEDSSPRGKNDPNQAFKREIAFGQRPDYTRKEPKFTDNFDETMKWDNIEWYEGPEEETIPQDAPPDDDMPDMDDYEVNPDGVPY